ncbi:MAG TPA: BTAD domain-containing putative transcriptional regulator, partial [Syntrophorhabdales bacterium]|nr:BTAD domain-containing putative transcriptional regulator [Syntrophorhabdales bacterium]
MMKIEEHLISQGYTASEAVPEDTLKALGLQEDHDFEEFQRPKLFLTGIPPFNQLKEPQLRAIAATMTWDFSPPGKVIIREGETSSGFYLIKRGLVRVSVSEQGKESILTTLSEEECFGEMSLLSGGMTTATVTAVEPTLCLEQGPGHFLKMVERYPSFHKFFSTLFIERMRGVYRQLLEHQKRTDYPLAQSTALRVYTLGRLAILKEGEPLTFGPKGRKKLLSLLMALVSLGGHEVTEERLTGLLWPDAEGDAAHAVFTTTLSRLRQLLGTREAIEIQGGRASVNSRHVWIDRWAFERLCDEADRLWKTGISSALIDCLQKALELYRGPFLPFEEEFWTISPREKLRNQFIRVVLHLGSCLEQRGEWKRAADCYQKGLEIDDLVEEFYQQLMIVEQKQGRRAEAIATYERCKKTLSTKPGIRPSAKT